jgi:hypothetical protein
MLKAEIRFITKTNRDDILKIFDDDVHEDMYRVVYKPHDVKVGLYETYLSYHDLQDYFSTILKSLERDTDPFEYVQVMTPIHPSVIYHVSDIEDRTNRWRLEDMVFLACRKAIWRRGVKRTIQMQEAWR